MIAILTDFTRKEKKIRNLQLLSPNVQTTEKKKWMTEHLKKKATMSRKVSISSLTLSEPMTKPARVQVNPEDIDDLDKTQQVNYHQYNIWYSKSLSNPNDKATTSKLRFRVRILTDEGSTKAKKNAHICLFFSRGYCYLGSKCQYLHRLPRESDNFKPTQDCFGRDKTANYQDDMDGVGSLNKVNCTLYVGGIHIKPNTEQLLVKNFQEFGTVEKVKVLQGKGCAFVTMKTENQAQFAKEAMQNQSLMEGSNEVLYVRWANEDKNPAAQKQEKKRQQKLAYDTVKQLLEQESNKKPRLENKTINIDDELEDEGAVEDDEADDDIDETSVSALTAGVKKNITIRHTDKTRQSNSTSDEKDHNKILQDSLLKDISRMKKKMMHNRKEPYLAKILVNYSSDDEDDE